MNRPETVTRPGQPGAPENGVQHFLRQDGDTRPGCLNEESVGFFGTDDIPTDIYTSETYAALEMERMWSRVWQMVCREEEIPEPGDHIVYDIGDWSFIIMRVAENDIRAFYNACLHRGTQLRASGTSGNVPHLRCPFHGFTWNLDGSLNEIPCEWDFPHVDQTTFNLPQARLDTWEGFVFINMDDDCAPLADFLGVLPDHFRTWEFGKRRIAAHVAKVVPCNWKVAMEAFMEGFHVPETHPQARPYTGDVNCQYDVWGPNISRMMSALATPSPTLAKAPEHDQDIVEAMRDFIVGDVGDMTVGDGQTARHVMADAMRRMLTEATGVDHGAYSISEILDAIEYYVFPNFLPWAGYGVPILYRFRPNGNDPHSSIIEVMLLYVVPEDAPDREPVPVHWLAPSDSWTKAEELGGLGAIFDQDSANFAQIQRGLRASKKPGVTLSLYQESRLRHYLATLDTYLAG